VLSAIEVRRISATERRDERLLKEGLTASGPSDAGAQLVCRRMVSRRRTRKGGAHLRADFYSLMAVHGKNIFKTAPKRDFSESVSGNI
jgi:hypothetical protein